MVSSPRRSKKASSWLPGTFISGKISPDIRQDNEEQEALERCESADTGKDGSQGPVAHCRHRAGPRRHGDRHPGGSEAIVLRHLDHSACLLYTSDAADERSSVD